MPKTIHLVTITLDNAGVTQPIAVGRFSESAIAAAFGPLDPDAPPTLLGKPPVKRRARRTTTCPHCAEPKADGKPYCRAHMNEYHRKWEKAKRARLNALP